jgi:hypothetical protein
MDGESDPSSMGYSSRPSGAGQHAGNPHTDEVAEGNELANSDGDIVGVNGDGLIIEAAIELEDVTRANVSDLREWQRQAAGAEGESHWESTDGDRAL